jgi:hypothetical protein
LSSVIKTVAGLDCYCGVGQMSKIIETEYGQLKAFLVAFMERFLPSVTVPPEHHPVARLELLEKTSMSKAERALGIALNDMLEGTWRFSPDEVAAIDGDFSARGIITLSEMRRRYSRQFRIVLKRGRIRTRKEFYLVSGILASFTADANEDERRQLGEMVAAYEESVTKDKRDAGR